MMIANMYVKLIIRLTIWGHDGIHLFHQQHLSPDNEGSGFETLYYLESYMYLLHIFVSNNLY